MDTFYLKTCYAIVSISFGIPPYHYLGKVHEKCTFKLGLTEWLFYVQTFSENFHM